MTTIVQAPRSTRTSVSPPSSATPPISWRTHPNLAEICDSVRFVRKRLLWRLPKGLDHGQEVGK